MARERIRTSETHPIEVDFLPDDAIRTRGRLGMAFAPGMKASSLNGDWERDLTVDIGALQKEHGVAVLVSLMEEHEYRGYGLPELYERDEFGGIEVRRFAIQDMGVPKEAESREFEETIRETVGNLKWGRTAAVHCRGGLGQPRRASL